ncbi:MAG: glycosyltransferase family 39 protein, partial [Aggregatilineales bacterium]
MTIFQVSVRRFLMLISIVAVLLLASGFYLWDLNVVSFWEDESWMAIAIDDGLPEVWTFATERGVHPPLYFYMAWFWSRLAGNGELALRWMGGLITLVGLAFTYRNGRELYNHRAGFFAVLLASGMIYLIYLTRLARHYTLYFALTALLLWVYQRWSRNKDDRYLAGITLTMAGLLYTHYFGIWMVLIVGVHSPLTHSIRRTIKLGFAFIGSAILFVPWLPSLDYQLRFSGQGAGIQYAIRDVEAIIRNYQDRLTNTIPELAVIMLVFAVIALIQAKKWRW